MLQMIRRVEMMKIEGEWIDCDCERECEVNTVQ